MVNSPLPTTSQRHVQETEPERSISTQAMVRALVPAPRDPGRTVTLPLFRIWIMMDPRFTVFYGNEMRNMSKSRILRKWLACSTRPQQTHTHTHGMKDGLIGLVPMLFPGAVMH